MGKKKESNKKDTEDEVATEESNESFVVRLGDLRFKNIWMTAQVRSVQYYMLGHCLINFGHHDVV